MMKKFFQKLAIFIQLRVMGVSDDKENRNPKPKNKNLWL